MRRLDGKPRADFKSERNEQIWIDWRHNKLSISTLAYKYSITRGRVCQILTAMGRKKKIPQMTFFAIKHAIRDKANTLK